MHWFRWKYFWGMSGRISDSRENSSLAIWLGYSFWMQKPNVESQTIALTHSGCGRLPPARIPPCSKFMWITHVSGDCHWSMSSLCDWNKEFFIKLLSMWKADPDRRCIVGKETNSTAQPSKCLRVPNLAQGAEIRVFTYMMQVHQHWLFSMYRCIFFSYFTKNVLMFSLIGIKKWSPRNLPHIPKWNCHFQEVSCCKST